jgi:hypothetical protein
VRFLIDDTDDASQYRGLLKAILRTPIDSAVPMLTASASGIAGSPIILTGIKVDGTLVINAAGLERFRSIHHKFLDFLNQPA